MEENKLVMNKHVLRRHKAGAFIEGHNCALDILKEKLAKEIVEADTELEEARRIEEDNDYSDAMESMERTYAEGFSDALALVLRLVEEEANR
jgi:hypothetical protein